MALCLTGVVYVVRSMTLCSIGGVYVVRSMALCSIGGVLSLINLKLLKHITPKNLREDHGTSGDSGASTAGKSPVALQGLLDRSTLAMKVGVTAVATVPFVTSYVEVTSIIRSPIPLPLVITAPVATTAVASTSYVPEAGIGPTIQSLFVDSTSLSATGPNTTGPSDPHGTEISADTFYISKEMDFETLQQIYIPKWNMINDSSYDDPEFNVGAACQTCLSAEVKLRSEHNLRERKKFERKCARQIDLLKEKDTEIASLKAQLSLKEAEAAKAIHLRSLVSVVEAAEAARVNELNNTKIAFVNTQVAKLNHDLSSLQLSCDELSIKATSLESQKDSLTDQYEVVQDEQVKILSDRVAKLDSELMSMAVHLDEEFYPRFLTTIAGRRWIISCGFRLAVMKCLQYPEYAAALGMAIGLAIDKGMHNRLVAGIDHGKAGRGVTEVAAYDPFMEERYVSAVLALYDMDFNFLSQLDS
ncbi:hypothetical protein Tco_0157817 [Tanacetum coccineum]